MLWSRLLTPLLVTAASLVAVAAWLAAPALSSRAQPVRASAGAFQFLLSWGSPGHARGAIDGPDNIAVDLRGTVYVADRDNNRIEEFSSSGTSMNSLGRNGGDGSAGVGNGEFDHP